MHLVCRVFVTCAMALPLHSYADKVIGVADGDTLTVLHAGKPLKIRLADIDAPEKAQAFGQVSKQSLSDMCFGKDATYQTRTVDKYGRTVARVSCAGVDVNRAQIEKGLAWVYTQYNADRSLVTLQDAVKANGKGLWAEKSPTPPWEFRHHPDTLANTVNSAASSNPCITGPRGGHYQIVNGHKKYGC